MLRGFLIGMASIYLIGALLTGFTFVQQKRVSGASSASMFSATVSYGMPWPVHVVKVLGRVIR